MENNNNLQATKAPELIIDIPAVRIQNPRKRGYGGEKGQRPQENWKRNDKKKYVAKSAKSATLVASSAAEAESRADGAADATKEYKKDLSETRAQLEEKQKLLDSANEKVKTLEAQISPEFDWNDWSRTKFEKPYKIEADKWYRKVVISYLIAQVVFACFFHCLSLNWLYFPFWVAANLISLGIVLLCCPLLDESITFEYVEEHPHNSDRRPDSLALNTVKHWDPASVVAIYRQSSIWSLVMRNSVEVKLNISLELLCQCLAQPTVNLGSDRKTNFMRIQQLLKSLHTVNDDRTDVLDKRHVRSNTSVVADLIFHWETLRLDRIPFPRPN